MPNKSSEKLKRNKEKIMQIWVERAQVEIRETIHQTTLALNNSLEGFLDQIAEALAITPQKTAEQARFKRELFAEFARSHGASRASMKNYTIEGLIREYHILRQTICDVLEEESMVDAREREIITSIIEQAVNDAASNYARVLRENREKFTATLVHDLRNPISVVMLGAQMILLRPSDAEFCLNTASRMMDRLKHVSSMISDVLDASQLGAGEELSLLFEKCELGGLLQRIVADYENNHPNRVRLEVDGEISGYWNPRALRRIVENLVTNALKYGSAEEPVKVRAYSKGQEAIIAVKNRGPAIHPDDLHVIFQQFRRTKSAETEAGWGLGLVVVKGLTEAHGGIVHVESNAEEGTTFTVTIPKDSRIAAAVPLLENVS